MMLFIEATEIRTNNADMVLFMSDWLACDEFVSKGYFRSEFGGPATYGHVSFYLTPKGREQSEIEANQPFVPFGAN